MLLERENGTRIYYEVHGVPSHRDPIILSHGFSSGAHAWAPNLEELAVDRTVITWDIRGHGRTEVEATPSNFSRMLSIDDLTALVAASGFAKVILGGLSLGGYLSIIVAALHPELVSALLLFDTGPGFRSDVSRERWNAWATAYADRIEADGLGVLPDTPVVGRDRHTSSAALSLAARYILTQEDSLAIDSLPGISVPTLILVGEEDEPYFAGAAHMERSIPGASSLRIPGAGHSSNMDNPVAFNAAVRAFLRHNRL